MKLLQMLQEASSADLEEVKKQLKKLPETKVLFKKDSTLADVPDVGKFLATLKFHLFNNRNLLDFAKSRTLPSTNPDAKYGHYAIKNVSAGEIAKYRQITADKIDEHDFQFFKQLIKEIFSEYASTAAGKLTPRAKKEVENWVNGNSGYHELSRATQTELSSFKDFKPTKKILLYRGILFKKYALESRKTWDGKTEEGNGLKFLKQIRDNSKIIDIEWDRPSSWTTSKEVADRFAKYGPAESTFSATLNWLNRGERAIDGELGFVIAIHANPDDVLVDISKIQNSFHQQHGDEGEVIIKPGKYFGKIVKKYTVHGEVDVANPEDASKNRELLDNAYSDVIKIEKLPIPDIIKKIPVTNLYNQPHLRDTTFEHYDFDSLVNPDKAKVVLRMTDDINAAFEKYQAYLKDIAEKYKDIEFTTDMANVGDEESLKKLKKIKQIIEKMKETVKSSHFADTGNKGPIWNIPVDKYRMSFGEPREIKELSDRLRFSSDPKVSDKDLAHWFNNYYKELTGESLSSRFDMLGVAKQDPAVEKVLRDFWHKLGIKSYPETKKEALTDFRNIVRRLYRNVGMMSKLKSAYEVINEPVDDVDD